MKSTLKRAVAILFVGVALALTGWAISSVGTKESPESLKGISPGLDAVQATSSRLELIGGTVQTLVASSTCGTRIISTKASPILLTFSEKVNDLPTATRGHLQAASTTVSYKAEEYGCGKVKALTADGLGTFITFTEQQ